MINGETRLLGVMGWPVSHSRSPVMHAAAIQSAGLNYAYVPVSVHPDRVAEAVNGLRALGFRGCNVTIPHKTAIIPFMDELTPTAKGAGAVNTIVIEDDGRMVGDNTDVAGAYDAILAEKGANVEGGHVIVVGAGGAARACAWGGGDRGAARVTIVNRTVEKAVALAEEFGPVFPGTAYEAARTTTPELLANATVVLQMTSLGMKPGDSLPFDPQHLSPSAVVLEAVYAPLETELLAECRHRRISTVDGLSMLVAQGALSLEKWTGVEVDRLAMRTALLTGD